VEEQQQLQQQQQQQQQPPPTPVEFTMAALRREGHTTVDIGSGRIILERALGRDIDSVDVDEWRGVVERLTRWPAAHLGGAKAPMHVIAFLFQLAQAGDFDWSSIAYQDRCGRTPLWHACATGNVMVVRFLVHEVPHAVPVGATTPDAAGKTPLLAAASSLSPVDSGCPVNARTIIIICRKNVSATLHLTVGRDCSGAGSGGAGPPLARPHPCRPDHQRARPPRPLGVLVRFSAGRTRGTGRHSYLSSHTIVHGYHACIVTAVAGGPAHTDLCT
jgi:hypothetical protein